MGARTEPNTSVPAAVLAAKTSLVAALDAGNAETTLATVFSLGTAICAGAPAAVTAALGRLAAAIERIETGSPEEVVRAIRLLIVAIDYEAASAPKTPLVAALDAGTPAAAIALIAAGADVAHADEDGYTALLAASRHGQVACVRALLEAGADVAQARPDGVDALMVASYQGHLACVRALLDAGADVVRASAPGTTALLYASLHGRLECVRALLEAGADVAQADQAGWAALARASGQGHLEVLRLLLDAGADVLQPSKEGFCALDCACHDELLGAFQLLCAYAPSREAVDARHIPCLDVEAGVGNWFWETRRWTSPLHHFEFLTLERVRALLVAGADARAGDGKADAPTPLGLAAARLRLDGGDARAALIAGAAAAPPWSPETHALFPARAQARAVELLRVGWLLARRGQQNLVADARDVEGALRDVWLGHVMPRAISFASG